MRSGSAPAPASARRGGGSTEPFDDADRKQLEARGIPLEEARRQLAVLRDPPPPARLLRAATVGDGIRALSRSEEDRFMEGYLPAVREGRASRFVPASGAASRMFRQLLPFADPETSPSQVEAADPAAREALDRFLENLDRFPFRQELDEALEQRGLERSRLLSQGRHQPLLETLLTADFLGYVHRPKALIPFHQGEPGVRTAFEEQLVEAAATTADARGRCRLHFTVVAGSEDRFRAHAEQALPGLRRLPGLGDLELEITYSTQSPATDTLALTLDGRPFRRDDGRLLLRPGGHGALLRNLAAFGGDLVFVKNIDNVLPDSRKGPSLRWKKVLGGLLVELQEAIHGCLEELEAPDGGAARALDLLTGELGLSPQTIPAGDDARRSFARERLHRPLRVCGVVVNQGEPGGGPFWVAGSGSGTGGAASLQIVEGAQIDTADPAQVEILQGATHFNPVDLVCGLKDHRGRPYDLSLYRDPAASFVAQKSHGGRPLKALEHPGLWNGAMARWNTVFVEVPAETFAPVKTVFDLLRPEHQS